MKTAIIALTRGYPNDRSLYSDLIKRNDSIFSKINKYRRTPSDIILFHEGNISVDDQEYINSHSKNLIKFVDVSKYFKKNELTLKDRQFNLGYRQMCRFNMYYIWNEVAEYDYILRIDEDIEIINIDPYIFEYMESKKIKFLTGRFSKEIHKITNQTLPNFLIKNTKLNVKKIYNHRFPYTNLYATSVSFWNKKNIQKIIKTIALNDDQIINRWGDIPVLGIILNNFNGGFKLFRKLEYRHISHDLTIKNNKIRNITVNSRFNPISVDENIFMKFKIRIKGKFKRNNKFGYDNN